MTLGIFTPSHKPHWLSVPYRTLKDQKYDKWLILLNGGISIDDVPSEIREDSRTELVTSEERGVGALKLEACTRLISSGSEVLLELDQDDELSSDALELVAGVPVDGFLYSNTASETRFGKQFGWTARSQEVNGHQYWVHDTPDVCARSLYEIFYAPNHLRAWGREAYLKSGGHDKSLTVCDDHDLLCKTYLAGVEMHHVDEPLYVQTEHKEQTQLVQNKQIQHKQAEIGATYLYRLVIEECRRKDLLAIDLGGRPGDAPDFRSLNRTPPADFIADLMLPLPLETHSVGAFRAHDILEHIPIGSVVPLMNELYRCLAPGGWLLTSTPSTDGRGAFQDPTHCSFWNSNSFWYYTRKMLADYVPEIECRFQLTRVVNDYPSPWHKLHLITYCDAALWALKGQRQIGLVEI